MVKALRRAQSRMKGDERILGDGEFAQSVLDAAKEQYEERYLLQTQGHDLETVAQRVSALLGINPEQVWASGKHPLTVKARGKVGDVHKITTFLLSVFVIARQFAP